MKIMLALCFALGLSSMASAQCENGVCFLPKVAATVQNVASVPFRVVSAVSQPASQPVSEESFSPVVAAAVPMRTPVRTILRAPFRARPLKRLFSGCR
jgi:hypothetical protein